jgi:hypothetical protein
MVEHSVVVGEAQAAVAAVDLAEMVDTFILTVKTLPIRKIYLLAAEPAEVVEHQDMVAMVLELQELQVALAQTDR